MEKLEDIKKQVSQYLQKLDSMDSDIENVEKLDVLDINNYVGIINNVQQHHIDNNVNVEICSAYGGMVLMKCKIKDVFGIIENEERIVNVDYVIYLSENKQYNIFYNIINMKYGLQSLAAYVQNDFEKVNNITNKETIKSDIIQMNKDYDNFIEDLNVLRNRAVDFMNDIIK